ncbi:hypothetical protein P7K49_033711 [Saguinus oedipus]|uniref:Uncharacterized protein n=1 Tax=Saguinus oedipus TaxID=9490 RepID=A0ABQ9TT55_SAGOE|nr:hypothetical protein P7K49_033711 [Saguinus oedipus]
MAEEVPVSSQRANPVASEHLPAALFPGSAQQIPELLQHQSFAGLGPSTTLGTCWPCSNRRLLSLRAVSCRSRHPLTLADKAFQKRRLPGLVSGRPSGFSLTSLALCAFFVGSSVPGAPPAPSLPRELAPHFPYFAPRAAPPHVVLPQHMQLPPMGLWGLTPSASPGTRSCSDDKLWKPESESAGYQYLPEN